MTRALRHGFRWDQLSKADERRKRTEMNHDAIIRNKSAKDVLQYWAELCEDGTAPLKSAIDPMALRLHLPHL